MKSLNILHILLLALTLLCTACATQGVSGLIGYEATLNRELSIKGTTESEYERGGQISIAGEYYGLISIDDKKYHAVKLKGIRSNCGKSHEAILYISTEPCIHPIIKETAGFDGQKIQDIEVVFDGGRINNFCCSYHDCAIPIQWNGFPDKLFIRFESTVQFRCGPGHRDICLLPIENELEWQCRSKSKYYAAHALYPFSVVYDVVTIPFQWLLWQIWH